MKKKPLPAKQKPKPKLKPKPQPKKYKARITATLKYKSYSYNSKGIKNLDLEIITNRQFKNPTQSFFKSYLKLAAETQYYKINK